MASSGYSRNMKAMILLFCALMGLMSAQEADQRVLGKSVEGSYADKVVVIEVGKKDLSVSQSFKFWERILKKADDDGAQAIVFDLNTPGGLAFPTTELMTQIANLKTPTISFVNPQALSAGTFVAVSTDRIYMKPGSAIGSAAIVDGTGGKIEDTMRAKLESFFDAHVRWIAEKKGYRKDVLRAMMIVSEKERNIEGNIVEAGALLALNSSEAIKPLNEGTLLATAEIQNLDALFEREGWDKADLVTATPTGFERLAWWVAGISGLLIVVGLSGGYFEIKTPGFGVGGVISLTAFGIFFFGNYLAGNMAGYELAALFVLGIVFIAIEIFVLPGFGIAGLIGLTIMIGSLVFAMVDNVAWERRQFEAPGIGWLGEVLSGPAMHLSFGIFGSLLILWAMMRFLPNIPFFGKHLLPGSVALGTGISEEAETGPRIGMTGTATTDLRPSGKAEIDGGLLDVVADGKFVQKGDAVRIIKEDGMGVVVKGA